MLDRLAAMAAAGDADAANFLAGWRAFIVEFGARGPNEWEMRIDTWETKPELALAALAWALGCARPVSAAGAWRSVSPMPFSRINFTTPITLALSSSVRKAAVDHRPKDRTLSGWRSA